MDVRSRQTASAYINNLLLSRGLLRNGTPIEFAKPVDAQDGLDGTMAQVMKLVHDLILRRDRETDTLKNLSTALTTAHQTTTSQAQQIAKLETAQSALERRCTLADAQERAARTTLRSAESRNKALREEMARLKGSVAQVRAQCATDIRRKDGDIARLKRHLEGRRGREGAIGVGVVVVSHGTGVIPGSRAAGDDESPTETLKQDTSEFLTRLSQGLSDENDALIGLVRGTLSTLRSLQGLPEETSSQMQEKEETFGTGLMAGPPSYEELALSTDEVLEHLRGLLTNPSFVPLEEVEMREEEIQRLREGWEKMAMRWKEAVALMDGWKTRMVDRGDTINLDDLSDGLKLGNGIPSAMEARVSPLKTREGKDLAGGMSNMNEAETATEDSLYDKGRLSEIVRESNTEARALASIDANARPSVSPRKSSFPVLPDQLADSLEEIDDLSLLDFAAHKKSRPSPVTTKTSLLQVSPRSPAHTVQQKLQCAEAEAEEARRRNERRLQTQAGANKVTKKLKSGRRRSTLSPEELENLMGIA